MDVMSRRSVLLGAAGVTFAGVAGASAETVAPPLQAALEPVSNDAVARLQVLQEELLSGRVFVVATGRNDDPASGQDVVRFAGGLISTDLCDRFGFRPAPYHLRADDGQLQLMAALTSATQDELRFTCRIAGDRLAAQADWRRPRWYGDVYVRIWFDGQLADPAGDHAAWLD